MIRSLYVTARHIIMWQATQRVCIFTLNPKLSVTFPLPWLDLHLSQLHFVIDGEGAGEKGESSPRSWPGAGSHHSSSSPLRAACSFPASSGKRAGVGRRLLSWLWTRWQAPTSYSWRPWGTEPGTDIANHQNSSES